MTDKLYGKRIVFDGDSICQALDDDTDGEMRGWAHRVGEKNGMECYNFAVGGGTVTAEMYYDGDKMRHWVSRSIDRIRERFETLDYLILEGGTNDADLLIDYPERFGELDPADYSGKYDDSTFTGAMESLFFKAINYYPTSKIGFIVAQKMGRPNGGYGPDYKRRKFFLRAIEVCRKWGVPYLDLWECSIINPSLKCHYDPDLTREENRAAGKPVLDGQHLTSVGYDMISPMIEAWVRGL